MPLSIAFTLSLDYFVFLLHRFQECRKDHADSREAMIDALCKSTSSIFSSGLTTVIGFAALCLMRFRIGPDLGMVLAKGVALSLLCVFVFMPNLILCTYKAIDKTGHKQFLPSFEKYGRFISRIMIPFAAVTALIIAPSFLASNANSYYYGASHLFNEETKLGQDIASIEEVFGKSDTYVLMVPNGDKQMQLALSDTLKEVPQVKDIISYVDTVTSDMMKVNLIAIGAVFVVLLLSMKSVTLPFILFLSIETAIWVNLSFPYFTDKPIFYIAYLIISSIQLGATVDYAILMTDRYLEHRSSMPKKEAIIATVSSCTVSILTSASVLTVVGFLLGYMTTHGLLAQLGTFIGRGTLCSLAIVMLALPRLLYCFDGLIQKTTKNADFYGGK